MTLELIKRGLEKVWKKVAKKCHFFALFCTFLSLFWHFLTTFLSLFLSILGSFHDKIGSMRVCGKWPKKRAKMGQKWPILGHFWSLFGSLFGSLLFRFRSDLRAKRPLNPTPNPDPFLRKHCWPRPHRGRGDVHCVVVHSVKFRQDPKKSGVKKMAKNAKTPKSWHV